MDVLILNPNDFPETYGILNEKARAKEAPFWCMLLAGALKKKGFKVRTIDSYALNLSEENLVQKVEEVNPRLVVIPVYGQHPFASTEVMMPTAECCDAIKKANPERLILILGTHPSALPELSLQQIECDFVAKGEGLYTITEILRYETSELMDHLAQIPGLYYRQKNDILHGPPAPLVTAENIDHEYPGIDIDDIDFTLYQSPFWTTLRFEERGPYGVVHTSLGCPFNCPTCNINVPHGIPSYRYWSVETILAQIDKMVAKGVRFLKFADELFTFNEGHFVEVCRQLEKRKYDLKIWTFIRVQDLKPEHLNLMRAAGIVCVSFGVESSDFEQRKRIHKGYSLEQIEELIEKIHQADISIIGNFIFGLPGETEQDMQNTLKLCYQLDFDVVSFYSFMAYPGSRYFEEDRQRILAEYRWENFSQYAETCKPHGTKFLTPDEVVAFRDAAWMEYIASDTYYQRVASRHGETVASNLQATLARRLTRKKQSDQIS